MFPPSLHLHHGQRPAKTPRIVDVDIVSARRARRRVLKKGLMSMLKPFHFYKSHKEQQQDQKDHTHSDTSKTGEVTEPNYTKVLPKDRCPLAVSMDDSLSLSTMSDLDSHVDTTTASVTASLECSAAKASLVAQARVLKVMLIANTARVICSSQSTASNIQLEQELLSEEVPVLNDERLPHELLAEIVHRAKTQTDAPKLLRRQLLAEIVQYSKQPTCLPQELLMEIVLFRWPLKFDAQRGAKDLFQETKDDNEKSKVKLTKPLSQELLHEIANYKKKVQFIQQQKLSQELLQELVAYKTMSQTKTVVQDRPNHSNLSSPSDPGPYVANIVHQNDELMALKERCAHLMTITELLSKQLVGSTLTKKKEIARKRQETKYFQGLIRKMEVQHHTECANLVSDKKYLEGQLRCTKIESVPPIIRSKAFPAADAKRRRRSLMDNLVTPVEACLKSPKAPRASFTMASTMILQNKLIPAMLSAVTHANE